MLDRMSVFYDFLPDSTRKHCTEEIVEFPLDNSLLRRRLMLRALVLPSLQDRMRFQCVKKSRKFKGMDGANYAKVINLLYDEKCKG